MNIEQLKSAIESLLFVSGEPMPISKLEKLLKISYNEVKEALSELSLKYQAPDSGLSLIFNQDLVQLATKGDNSEIVRLLVEEELQSDLSRAALEVLAIIAYRFPVSRAQIDEIRGVDSSYILRNLTVRGLTEREPHPQRANAFVYKPSFQTLKILGLEKLEDLPDWQRVHEENLGSLIQPENNTSDQSAPES